MTVAEPRVQQGITAPATPLREMPGLLRNLWTDRLALMRWAAGYGDAVRMSAPPVTMWFFNHPDTAKHVLADNSENYHKGIGLKQARASALGDGLLTADGDIWKEQRREIQPAFQARRIAAQATIIAEEAKALTARLRLHAGKEPLNIEHELTGLTLGVLGRTLLDTEISAYDHVGHSFESVQDQAMFDMVTLDKVPAFLPTRKRRELRKGRAYLHEVADELVEKRRASGTEADDALSRVISSADKIADPQVRRSRLREEIITLLLAGHETTASTLGWVLHLMDRHPEARERLREEAVSVLGDRDPVYEDLNKLTYHARFLDEVMRLFPPVWILPRIAQQDDVVGGYHVPAGADVLVCPYTLHRHPEFWDRPDEFDPTRFEKTRAGDRPRYAYIPFGAGPRVCIGSNLGLLEAAFVLAVLNRELVLDTVPGYEVIPEPMLSLRVKGGLPMKVTARD